MEEKNKEVKIDYRFLARVIIEAITPLALHSGDREVQTDAVVIKDVNGLPYIPGSSLAGVIRHAWKDAGKSVNKLFGFQKNIKDADDFEQNDILEESEKEALRGIGSRIVFSEARILDSEGKVVDGLQSQNDSLLNYYANLPVRQHVRITHRGVAADKGKFDEQVVFAGTRFCFEMEMLGNKEEAVTFAQLLSILSQSAFRLGGGSRKGFGKVEVKEIMYSSLPIQDKAYLDKSSNLEESKVWYNKYKTELLETESIDRPLTRLCYQLRPENFFLFGSGFGDDDADMTPVKEQKVSWKNGNGHLAVYEYLIPGSSIKGALAHRTAFHYNQLDGFFADGKTKEEIEAHSGNNNEAVRLLFGWEGDAQGKGKQRGNVMISDLFVNATEEKVFNHVAIDRFTGGGVDGALFAEKALYWHSNQIDDYPLKMEVLIDDQGIEKADKKHIKEKACKAFSMALDDLCNGLLPLGGGVNKGHGIFDGKNVNKYGN